MDKLSPQQRSALMARIKSRNTAPEKLVRSAAHKLGLRFSLHRRDLKGSPDIVFPKHRVVIFVHGCFWHQHSGCKRSSVPVSRAEFWKAKLKRNVQRDAETIAQLKAAGWRVAIVWECETKENARLNALLKRLFRKALSIRKRL